MNIEQVREYCIAKKGTTEEFPFDNHTLVFKVMGKMFLMIPLEKWEEGRQVCIVKTDPDWALELRDTYSGFLGGFQMGKSFDAKFVYTKHWNSIANNSDVSDQVIKELIDHSYDLVVQNLTKKVREELKRL